MASKCRKNYVSIIAKLRLAECTILWYDDYEENESKDCPFYHSNVNLH